MSKRNLIQIKREFPNTHFFVYKKGKFPFNFDLFNLTSPVFSDRELYNKDSKYIQLLSQEEEQNFEINDESIRTFIQYVHREPISIDDDNVLVLNYLGHKYQIDELIESTKEYIAEHQSNLVLEILVREENQNENMKDLSTYEDIVSEHFLDYIDDNRMLNLPIYVIYRLFQNYQQTKRQQKDDQNQHKNDEDESNKIFNFLIKCLDKFGRQASVLFGELDFDQAKPQYLNVLLQNKYSKSFDFHFFNSNLNKMRYEQENELFLKMQKSEKDQNDIIEKLRIEINELKKNQDNQTRVIDELKAKIGKLEKQGEKQGEINRQFEEQKQEIIQIKKEQEKQKRGIESKMKQIDDANKEAFKKCVDEIENLKKEIELKKQNDKRLEEKEEEKNKDLVKQQESLRNELERIKKEIEENKKAFMNDKGKIGEMETKVIETVQFDNNSSNRFNGILTRLGNGNAMNSLDNGNVDITASSIVSSDEMHQPKNVLNYGSDSMVFYSNDEPNSWLCIEFKNHRVNPSHYSIRSTSHGGKGWFNLQSWDIQGSNDYSIWDTLDSRRNDTSIDGESSSNTFQITNSANKHKYYKYLRIIQRDKNTIGNNVMFFSSIEFFGNIGKK